MKHIEFLQRLGIAGVSHHSLLFSKTAAVPTVHENDKIQRSVFTLLVIALAYFVLIYNFMHICSMLEFSWHKTFNILIFFSDIVTMPFHICAMLELTFLWLFIINSFSWWYILMCLALSLLIGGASAHLWIRITIITNNYIFENYDLQSSF